MTTTLSTLPRETIHLVAKCLDFSDSCSLRLVSKSLYSSTRFHFERTFFATVSTNLTPKSLQSLHDISQKEHLRHHVQTLQIKECCPSKEGRLGQGFAWPRGSGRPLGSSFPGMQILQRILLEGLPKCRSFQIDYNSPRDANKTDRLSSSDAIAIVFRIIAETGLLVKNFTRLSSHKRKGDSASYEDDFILHPDPWSLHQLPVSKEAWSQLEAFRFDEIWDLELLAVLMSNAPNLHNLSLSFKKPLASSFNHLYGLFSDAKHIQHLSLDNINIDAYWLSNSLLHTSRTLHVLALSHISLSPGSWKAFCLGLSSDFPHLERFALAFLEESDASHHYTDHYKQGTLSVATHQSSVHVSPNGELQLIWGKWGKGKKKVAVGAGYTGPQIHEASETLASLLEFHSSLVY